MTVTTENTTRTHDPYASIADLDEAVVATLADRIDTRAADPHQRRLWREALSRPTYPDQATVLEVGCGTGVITAMIADLTGVAAAVGVDPSPYFVERARQRAPSLRFEVADGRSLPFDDQTFDGVVLATTLCHIPAPEQALAEAHRVLRPGGQILVYDGDYTSTTVAVSRHDPLQACVDAAIAAIVHSPWLCRRLRPLVAAAGFMSEELHSHGYPAGAASSPTYLLSMIDYGADTLASHGGISRTTAEALKAEARHRINSGSFYGHITYTSLLARRGEEHCRHDSPPLPPPG